MSHSTPPKPDDIDLRAYDTIIDALSNDQEKALWQLASVIEGCLFAIGEDIETFTTRVVSYARSRS